MYNYNNMEITYDIRGVIGEGSGGTVYLAYHKRLQKQVVLKQIHPGIVNLIDCRAEADILKNLKNEYLPQVYDFIETSNGIFTVMDYVEGESLQRMLDDGCCFNESVALKFSTQLCQAVSYLHRQPIPVVHGDIKPENIMLTPSGNICLIDFNVSGFSRGDGVSVIGFTPGYSSPEQQKACELPGIKVDSRSDIYSIGATLYTLLYRKKLDAHTKIKLGHTLSKPWRKVISKATKKQKENRYQTVDAILEALGNIPKVESELTGLRKKCFLKVMAYGILIILFVAMMYIGGNMTGINKDNPLPVETAWLSFMDGNFSNGAILVISGAFLGIISVAGLIATLFSNWIRKRRVLHILDKDQ